MARGNGSLTEAKKNGETIYTYIFLINFHSLNITFGDQQMLSAFNYELTDVQF